MTNSISAEKMSQFSSLVYCSFFVLFPFSPYQIPFFTFIVAMFPSTLCTYMSLFPSISSLPLSFYLLYSSPVSLSLTSLHFFSLFSPSLLDLLPRILPLYFFLFTHSTSSLLLPLHSFDVFSPSSFSLIPLHLFLFTYSSLLLPLYFFLFTYSFSLIPLHFFLFTSSSLLLPLHFFLFTYSFSFIPLYLFLLTLPVESYSRNSPPVSF